MKQQGLETGKGFFPYMNFIGMCGHFLVLYSGLELEETTFLLCKQKPFKNYVSGINRVGEKFAEFGHE